MIAAFKVNHAKQRENSKGILDLRDHNGDQRDGKRFVSVTGLLGAGIHDRFAQYAASRSIAILLVVPIFLGFRSRIGIAAMALTMSLVQLFDAVIGALSHDSGKTYGPLFLALIGFVSVAFLLHGAERIEPQNRL
jgi:hypothetical protein